MKRLESEPKRYLSLSLGIALGDENKIDSARDQKSFKPLIAA